MSVVFSISWAATHIVEAFVLALLALSGLVAGMNVQRQRAEMLQPEHRSASSSSTLPHHYNHVYNYGDQVQSKSTGRQAGETIPDVHFGRTTETLPNHGTSLLSPLMSPTLHDSTFYGEMPHRWTDSNQALAGATELQQLSTHYVPAFENAHQLHGYGSSQDHLPLYSQAHNLVDWGREVGGNYVQTPFAEQPLSHRWDGLHPALDYVPIILPPDTSHLHDGQHWHTALSDHLSTSDVSDPILHHPQMPPHNAGTSLPHQTNESKSFQAQSSHATWNNEHLLTHETLNGAQQKYQQNVPKYEPHVAVHPTGVNDADSSQVWQLLRDKKRFLESLNPKVSMQGAIISDISRMAAQLENADAQKAAKPVLARVAPQSHLFRAQDSKIKRKTRTKQRAEAFDDLFSAHWDKITAAKVYAGLYRATDDSADKKGR